MIYLSWVIFSFRDENFIQERRIEQEKAEAQLNVQRAKEVEHAKMARDISNEVNVMIEKFVNFGDALNSD